MTTPTADEDEEKVDHSYSASGDVKSTAPVETILLVAYKSKYTVDV